MAGEFVKLYGKGSNQIVAILCEGDEGPQVAIYFQPKGLGVCSTKLGYETWEDAEAGFQKFTEKMGKQIRESLRKQFTGKDE